uniref:Retrovirus-related Pol polyprotein from transposon opus n=1 Tax=Tanacetum cinerariifolium TaxID=118510 RepID=A0A6L2NTN1_TANCI|nr:retrovirus-related Pol polyprotein from transposon opus [Tanacetum cinerariifolium]
MLDKEEHQKIALIKEKKPNEVSLTVEILVNPEYSDQKFLGYMVTYEGIHANSKKKKALADMQSPITIREMQSLSGKLASLKRFLARSTERMLNETKKNYVPTGKASSISITYAMKVTKVSAGAVEEDTIETYTLFTDGESNNKGSREGLVVISPSGTEYTHSPRLNFTSTNNEAKCKTLLVGLRIAASNKVYSIDAKVDSKLEAS